MSLPGQQQTKQRMFSIMSQRIGVRLQPIPFVVLQSHEAQAKINHGGQTLDRLHERGGLDPFEAMAVLNDRPCYGPWWDDLRRLSFEEVAQSMYRLVLARMELLANAPTKCTHAPRPDLIDNRGVTKCPNCGEMIVAA